MPITPKPITTGYLLALTIPAELVGSISFDSLLGGIGHAVACAAEYNLPAGVDFELTVVDFAAGATGTTEGEGSTVPAAQALDPAPQADPFPGLDPLDFGPPTEPDEAPADPEPVTAPVDPTEGTDTPADTPAA